MLQICYSGNPEYSGKWHVWFYQLTDGVVMEGPASSKFICRLMNKLQYIRLCTLQKFGNDLLMLTPLLNVST